MSLPCEVAVKCLLPPIRAAIANELTDNYHMKQADIAKLLGVSQPAISLYYSKTRGVSIDLQKNLDIMKLAKETAESLAMSGITRKEFILGFCEICRAVRSKGLLCELHKSLYPALDVDNCKLCLPTSASSGSPGSRLPDCALHP